jgi:carboxylesterase type B
MRWTEPLIRYNFQGETHDHRNYQKACATHQEDPYTSEDCLGINISVPRNALEESRAVPIIYNIHGGGFNQGNNRGRPGNLIKKEQVAIFNIAYRLG